MALISNTLLIIIISILSITPLQSDHFKASCPRDKHSELGCSVDNLCESCADDSECEYCQTFDPNQVDTDGTCDIGTCLTCSDSDDAPHSGFCGDIPTTTNTEKKCEWERSGSYGNSNRAFEYNRICEAKQITTTFGLGLLYIDDGTTTYETGAWQNECTISDTATDTVCSVGTYGGVKAIQNTFTSYKLDWECIIFLDSDTAIIDGNSVAVKLGAVKFGVMTDNWIYSDTLTVCFEAFVESNYDDMDILTAAKKERLHRFKEMDNGRKISFGEYSFNNDMAAECEGYDDISVTPKSSELVGDGNRMSLRMCYEFGYCASGNIVYDPFVYYEGEEQESIAIYHELNYIMSVLIIPLISLYLL